MNSMPDDLPDDPVLLKQMLLEAYAARSREQEVKEAYATHIVDLKEQIKLLRDRLFGRKSEQAIDPNMKKSSRRRHAVENASHSRLTCHVSKSSTNCLNTN